MKSISVPELSTMKNNTIKDTLSEMYPIIQRPLCHNNRAVEHYHHMLQNHGFIQTGTKHGQIVGKTAKSKTGFSVKATH